MSMALVVWVPVPRRSRCPMSNIYCDYPGQVCAICGWHQCGEWEGSAHDPTTGRTYCPTHRQPTSRGD
jgi:hypothetical protein